MTRTEFKQVLLFFFKCSVSCFKAAHLYSHPPALQERKTAHPSGTEINILLSLKHKQQRNPSPLVSNCQFNLAIFSKSLLWILWRCQHIHYGLCFLLSQPLCSGNTHLVPLPVSKRKTALMKSRPHLTVLTSDSATIRELNNTCNCVIFNKHVRKMFTYYATVKTFKKTYNDVNVHMRNMLGSVWVEAGDSQKEKPDKLNYSHFINQTSHLLSPAKHRTQFVLCKAQFKHPELVPPSLPVHVHRKGHDQYWKTQTIPPDRLENKYSPHREPWQFSPQTSKAYQSNPEEKRWNS